MFFKKLNNYFFGSEVISLSDFLWFYGMIALITLMVVIAVVPKGGM